MVGFSELLEKRRSIRDFEKRDVPLEIIHQLIEDSCLAPSSGNGQPWKFIIVNKKELIREISDDCKKNNLSKIEENPNSENIKYEAMLRSPEYNIFYNAPCVVFIVGSSLIRSLYLDCSLAACYFMMSATRHGLGTCWIGFGTNIKNLRLLNLIGLPQDHIIVAPIIIGYPKRIPEVPTRKEPEIISIIT